MALKGIKTSRLFERKSKAKVVTWKARERVRQTEFFQVEIGASTSRQITGIDPVRMEIVDQGAVPHDAGTQSMDIDACVDEPSWIDEDVPEQTRVRSHSCPFSLSFDVALSPSVPTWKSLFLGSAPT